MDIELAVCQLVGTLLFAWMIGLRFIDHQDCLRIVDDFLIAHRLDETAGTPPDT
jgi:TetR/AcrR family transcriptional regulator of autoinduction and epiphytic fitness